MFRFVSFWVGYLIFFSAISQNSSLITDYEKSGGKRTPRYEASVRYCQKLDSASRMIHFGSFGQSPQGRDLSLLILDKDGLTEPEEIRKAGRIILMIQACIHPGESEGKDAGFLLFRELGVEGKHPEWLQSVSIAFLPIFNVDGHERFGPYNRINQNGPEEMGWRTNARNLNLNRDYLKADALEMRAWLRLFQKWMPEFFIDCHTTDGADYEYVITYALETHGNMDPGLSRWQEESFLPPVEAGMEKAGFPIFPYVTFRNWHDPRSGLIAGVSPPMLSQGYTAMWNRPGLLIETHMLKPYKIRVEGTLEMFRQSLSVLSHDAPKLKALIRDADALVSSADFRKTPMPLRFDSDPTDSVMVSFKGVEYDVRKSDLTGGDWFVYSDKPERFSIPFFQRNKAAVFVQLPECYYIPPEWTEVVDRLEWHGIRYSKLEKEEKLRLHTCRFRNAKWRETPFEGRHTLSFSLDSLVEDRILPVGTIKVPVAQAGARVLVHLLDPKAPGSLLFWGFFDAVFEQKEYAETYVMEPLARKMISENPNLLQEFEEWKKENPARAGNQWEQLNWFYARTPWFDQRVNIYPVGWVY